MNLTIDQKDRSVSFALPRAVYSREGIEIAAQVFSNRTEVLLGEDDDGFELTLRSKRKTPQSCELEALGGEFLNELLNQEYRMVVGKFNRKISSLIVTQALFSARGGETPAAKPAGEDTPEFKKQVSELLKQAREEIRKTMPKKLPPQGTPLPPQREEAGA